MEGSPPGPHDRFADVSGDRQRIHTDVGRAAYSPFGRTIAHGYMMVSWSLRRSQIRLHALITEVREVRLSGVQMRLALTVEPEGSAKPGCVAEPLTHFHP